MDTLEIAKHYHVMGWNEDSVKAEARKRISDQTFSSEIKRKLFDSCTLELNAFFAGVAAEDARAEI